MVRMRTIEQAYEDIKAADNDTAITKHAIRQLVLSHTVPYVKRGNKYLINLDALIGYLSGGEVQPVVSEYGKIRRIAER